MSVVLLLLLASAPVERARELSAALRFKAVVEVLAPEEQQLDAEGAELLARALVALGRPEEAEAVWVGLLRREPGITAPADTSPKLLAVFERARVRVPPPPPRALPTVALPPPPLVTLPPPRFPPIVLSPPPPASTAPRWLAWSLTASAVVWLIAGVALAVSANSDVQSARSAHFASDARALDDRAFRNAAASNVVFAGALVCGVTSGILHWRWR